MMTIEDLGKKTKAKYPEYANLDDAEVGKRVIAKYPQYQAQVKQPNVLEKVMGFLTPAAKNISNDVGRAMGMRAEDPAIQESQGNAQEMLNKVMQRAQAETDPAKKAQLLKMVKSGGENLNSSVEPLTQGYSKDIEKNYVQRGVQGGAEVALLADLISSAPSIIKNTYKVGDKAIHPTRTMAEIRNAKAAANTSKVSGDEIYKGLEDYVQNKKVPGASKKLDSLLADAKDLYQGKEFTVEEALKIKKDLWDQAMTLSGRFGKPITSQFSKEGAILVKNQIKDLAPEVAKMDDLLSTFYKGRKIFTNVLKRSVFPGSVAAGAAGLFK